MSGFFGVTTRSTLDAVFVEVSEDDAELQVDAAHRLSSQVVPVCAAVDEVRVAQLGAAAQKRLRYRLAVPTRRPPCGTRDLMQSWRRRHVTETVAVKLVATEAVLVPNLEVQLGPTWQKREKCATKRDS